MIIDVFKRFNGIKSDFYFYFSANHFPAAKPACYSSYWLLRTQPPKSSWIADKNVGPVRLWKPYEPKFVRVRLGYRLLGQFETRQSEANPFVIEMFQQTTSYNSHFQILSQGVWMSVVNYVYADIRMRVYLPAARLSNLIAPALFQMEEGPQTKKCHICGMNSKGIPWIQYLWYQVKSKVSMTE